MSNPEQWLQGKTRRALELSLIANAAPGICLTALLSIGALKLEGGSDRLLSEVERSLYPGNTYTIRKLSTPHSRSRAAAICRKAMVDELPQVADIVIGTGSLWGPRSSNPEHTNNSYAALELSHRDLRKEALWVSSTQLPGILSSYAIFSHANNLDALEEEQRFPDGLELESNAVIRHTLNVLDRRSASFGSEMGMLVKAIGMVGSNYSHYIGASLSRTTESVQPKVQ